MKYTKAMIEAVELDVQDVVLTSGCPSETPACSSETVGCPSENPWQCDAELV